MKRMIAVTIPAADQGAHEVPHGVPVAVTIENRRPLTAPHEAIAHLWFEVHVPGHDFDPATYDYAKQMVRFVTSEPVPDAWRWLTTALEGDYAPTAYHLYEVRP